MKGILETFLDMLEVKHTASFTDRYFNEHPHKYNLFGLSKMLSDYHIANGALRIPDKEQNISEIKTPFIAQFGGDFVAVSKVEPERVFFVWKGLKHVTSITNFNKGWTGIVLLAETSDKSIEPDYRAHRKTDTLNLLKKAALIASLGLIAILAYIHRLYYTNVGISLLLLVNLVGMYIGWLLLLKQQRIQSQYADKICSLFKQKDCNNVLESKAAKLFGLISLSEIGFGYFTANVLLLLLYPTSLTAIALFNILTLPFTLWSIWYQWKKAKQWCVLCLITLSLLWTIFLINLLFGYIQIPVFSNPENNSQFSILNSQFLFALCGYCTLILSVHLLAPKLNADSTNQSLQQSINSLKADEDVFAALLKKQTFYETNDCDSVIRFGNPDSKLRLTVLSNPYCNPCAKMHQRIEELLKQTNNAISVQYILSSFRENLNETNKYLIAACLAATSPDADLDNTEIHSQFSILNSQFKRMMRLFHDWFEKGKPLRDDYFKEMGLDMDNPAIEAEFQKHEAWKQKTQIKGTPTVLVNGYQLPETYKVEDLRYFTDLNL